MPANNKNRRYRHKLKDPDTYCGVGRRPGTTRPQSWVTGPDDFAHEQYYAWLKHRAQARHRGELYDITIDEWRTLWPQHLFEQRGRSSKDLCCKMLDPELGWTKSNVEVMTRREGVQMQHQLKKLGK